MSYKTGDSLAVWPRNPLEKVEDFCKLMGFDSQQNLRVLPQEGARNWCPQELSVRQLFSHVLDIFGKPNRKFFETLSFFAKAVSYIHLHYIHLYIHSDSYIVKFE